MNQPPRPPQAPPKPAAPKPAAAGAARPAAQPAARAAQPPMPTPMTNMQKLTGFLNKCYVWISSILPTLALSKLMWHICRIQNAGFKNAFISVFVKIYDVDLSEAEFEIVKSYPDFATFFTRALKPDARPIDPNPSALISPVDGALSALGPVRDGMLIQAKGIGYNVSDLLGGSKSAALFAKGNFCTLYLAPSDYHRIHMPANGKLREWGYVPGRLFSVSRRAVDNIPQLFTRNERVFSIFETDYGPLAMVMVGALFVGSMETVWNGVVTPPHGHEAGSYTPMQPVVLLRGREMGRFNMGSTVILLTPPGMVTWSPRLNKRDVPVKMGSAIGTLNKIR